METWLIFAILSALTAWIYNFSIKIAAERNYNSSLLSVYSYASFTILSLGYVFVDWLINWFFVDGLFLLILLASWNAFFFFLSILSRVDALRNIHTVIFYPIYKTFWPIIVTLMSLFFFKETLNLKEVIWIVLGILVPLLLITKVEGKIQKNLKRGVLLTIVTSILSAVATWFLKEWINDWFNPIFMMLVTSVCWFIFSSFSYQLTKEKTKSKNFKKEWIIKFGFLNWFLLFLSTLTYLFAIYGNLAIVFTINSFSILVPIILSIIFYKEHFNLKKAIVLILSIISIFLFI